MEVEEEDRIVIAKPVASRPTSSSFGSFSEPRDDAKNCSPPGTNEHSEIEVSGISAIRPRTVRPSVNRAPYSAMSQESCGAPPSSLSEKAAGIEKQSTMVFRPLAKTVSKATVSLLASMGHFNSANQQVPPQVDNQNKGQLISNQPPCNLPQAEQSQPIEPPVITRQMLEEEHKAGVSFSVNVDRVSSDGYNWRKYGQKQVKGSEHPRSYYKCTHPDCPVKKKVERSLHGEIAEIVYKGEHSHPMPHLPKSMSSGVQGQDLDSNKPEPNDNVPESRSSEVSAGINSDPKRKKRKYSIDQDEAETCNTAVERRIWVRNSTEPEIMGDGYRWRKYGQKVVRGNPHPRSYYRCTSPKCNVRKHVERALDDPSAFITTYEGKHNHERP